MEQQQLQQQRTVQQLQEMLAFQQQLLQKRQREQQLQTNILQLLHAKEQDMQGASQEAK